MFKPFKVNPVNTDMIKVTNRKTRKMYEICPKLKIKFICASLYMIQKVA